MAKTTPPRAGWLALWCCGLLLTPVAAGLQDEALQAGKPDNSSSPTTTTEAVAANSTASPTTTKTTPPPAGTSPATAGVGRAMGPDAGAATPPATSSERGSLQDLSLDDIDISAMTSTASPPARNDSCEDGGRTYKVGEHFHRGCEAACSCEAGGQLRCAPRCDGPFFRRGLDQRDPACVEKPVDDPCCAILVCSHDTEVEPLEGCVHKNQTYQRGDVIQDGCEAVCKCGEAGRVACKPRCPQPASNSSDRCVSVPDPADSCCSVLLCDVTLHDQDAGKAGSEQPALQPLAAEALNGSAVRLSLPGGGPAGLSVELSEDQQSWARRTPGPGLVVAGLAAGRKYYVRARAGGAVSNTAEVFLPAPPAEPAAGNQSARGCQHKGRAYEHGEEFHDGCAEYCACADSEVHCAVIECPTDFGLDVLDPSCLEWETRPAGFAPSPPHCCPDHVVCRDNGSCEFGGQRFDNWQELPGKLTGCERRCYCELGNVTCQPTCPPVAPSPPPELACPPGLASLGHLPGDDCCLYWLCPQTRPPGASNDSTVLRLGGQTMPVPKEMNSTRQNSTTNGTVKGDSELKETEQQNTTTTTEPNLWLPHPLTTERIQGKDILPKLPGPINLSNFPFNKPKDSPKIQVADPNPADNQMLIPGPFRLDHQDQNKMIFNLPSRISANTTSLPVTVTMPNEQNKVIDVNTPDENKTMPTIEHVSDPKINLSLSGKMKHQPQPNISGIMGSNKQEIPYLILPPGNTYPPSQGALPTHQIVHIPVSMPPKPPVTQPDVAQGQFITPGRPVHPVLPPTQPGEEYYTNIPLPNKPDGRVPEIFNGNPYHPQRPGPPEVWLSPRQPAEVPAGSGPPGKEHAFGPPGYFGGPSFKERPQTDEQGPTDEELEQILSHLQRQGVLPPHYTVHGRRPARPDPEGILVGHLQQQGLLPQLFHPPMRPPPPPAGKAPPHRPSGTPGLHLPADQVLQLQYQGLLPPTHYFPGQHVDLLPQPALNYTRTVLPDGRMPPGQPNRDTVTVQMIEAVNENTVRLVFSVPPVLVGLHGRVELRYTADKLNDDPATWQRQVLAPPHDLIATPQLEFELGELQPDTAYKIKVAVMLRDLANSPSSEVLVVKTLPHAAPGTTLPPLIAVEPELVVAEVNATWVRLAWRKFTEHELNFIDGIQLRYKEIDGKVYAATPLIHRAVTGYTLEDLRPSTSYEIRIFFIPFPGQTTELQADHPLLVKTLEEHDLYKFDVKLEVHRIKSMSVELTWSGVPYPEDKYVNIFRAIYQSDSGKEDFSSFKIAKRDSQPKTLIQDLKPGTRYRLWLEVYLTNGKIKKSNVQDFMTKPGSAPDVKSTQGKLESEPKSLPEHSDYYGALVGVAIIAALAVVAALILLLILVRKYGQTKAAITGTRKSQSAYDNPSYKTSENEPVALNGSSAATKTTPPPADNA